MPNMVHLHASCVSIGEHAVLLFGPSGSGKSDVALRLVDAGAVLVSDDQVVLTRNESALLASPPEHIHGMLEARGVGILHLPYVQHVPVNLAVKLLERSEIERFPTHQFFDCLGLQVPLLSLYAFDASTCAKIRAALRYYRAADS